MLKNTFAAAIIIMSFAACKPKAEKASSDSNPQPRAKDVHTLSNADSIDMRNLDLDIKVDMQARQIAGSASWTVNNRLSAKQLTLDTYDLTIDSVSVDQKPVAYVLDSQIEFLGSALHIPILANTTKVKVYYRTGKKARALQWLNPQQTHDKTHPFLFTQSESIYARSWIPCADGPGIRFTYSARVNVPKGLMALMSALNPEEVSPDGNYTFSMSVPIPAYLMALAVGDITFKKINERTGVYAEPGMIEKCHHEFEDVGEMVNTAEQLYGNYQWGRYDVLVLPPGFPIGGMENPRLTFCTPTVIAGDKSLVSLIAHELAHSWSGNLVTNATWDDFWLNEGFTVYFERRIMEKMQGKGYADMLWELGYQDLVKEVKDMGADSKDTWLKLQLKDRDPDDGLTDIPYEKGALFLQLMENNVGRERFDMFLGKYFESHSFKTITTEEFLVYMDSTLFKDDAETKEKLNIKAWVYGPGIPDNCPRADQERFLRVDSARAKFLSGAPAAQLTVADWTTHEWLHFLRKMPETLTVDQMKKLDDAFMFRTTGNSEIADLWFIMSVRTNYTASYPAMEQFLSSVGRRKFLEPLYGEMMKTGSGAEMARRLYGKYRGNYHPLAQESLDRMVLKKS